ncbi:MAG: hypothetical protein ACRET1_05900 [Burkholderiales bacterium]
MIPKIHVVDVFSAVPHGGNPAPIVVDAARMPDAETQDVAWRQRPLRRIGNNRCGWMNGHHRRY